MRIPLHGKGTPVEVLDMYVLHNAMNPKGFRQVPTSKKNPRTKAKRPTTRTELLAEKVYGRVR